MDSESKKLTLPAFLKMLTSNNVPPTKAIAVAGKIYKTHNTPEQLGTLSDYTLESAGVSEKDLRKLVLAAVRKAGYKQKASSTAGASRSVASSSKQATQTDAKSNETKRKRKRDNDLNELLPDKPQEEGDSFGSLEFNEILDEEAIKPKYTVINRAPVMMAWAFVVAERLGFQREEALSIASVYTEMNAITKGVSLGIYGDSKQKGREASRTGSQPYVELMGRRIPLYQTAPSPSQPSQWRALSSGSPVAPTSAFSYITRSLRQTAPHILGALRLLAASYTPAELNTKGFALYADFRPEADGWGQRGDLRCSAILALRKPQASNSRGEGTVTSGEAPSPNDLVKIEPEDVPDGVGEPQEERSSKKVRTATPPPPERDEFDEALDDGMLFDDFDLSTIP